MTCSVLPAVWTGEERLPELRVPRWVLFTLKQNACGLWKFVDEKSEEKH